MTLVDTALFVILWVLLGTIRYILPGLISTTESVCSRDSFLNLQGLNLNECKNECLKRKRCKSVWFDKRFPLCKLNEWDEVSSTKPCGGFIFIDMKKWDRPDACDKCNEIEVCQSGKNTCVIKECKEPSLRTSGYFLGNRHIVGSKRIYVCSPGYRPAPLKISTTQRIICGKSGVWKPEIDDCIDTDECVNNPCRNGATCQNNEGSYSCICMPGYEGDNCGEDKDECINDPCLNGASCVNSEGSYSCSCLPEYEGDKCGEDKDECLNNPCLNGATCVNTEGSYSCTCLPGYKGDKCGQDKDECVNNPCLNGATCINTEGSYNCGCLPGYDGHNCGEAYKIICENTEGSISCSDEHGTVLNILYANYGRTSDAICVYGPSFRTDCPRNDAIKTVKELCQDRKSCVLLANNNQFHDTCQGTFKYLEIHFQCIIGDSGYTMN